jgi:hypothetical protein
LKWPRKAANHGGEISAAMKRPVRTLLFFAMLAAAVPGAAQAQSLFDMLFGPRRWYPEQRQELDRPKEKEDPATGAVYNSSNDADADPKRQSKPQEYVVVIGDTIAEQLAQGLAEAFFAERPEVAIIKKTRASSGLVRSDFYNWIAEAGNIVANERATAFVVALGSNDRQPLRDETGAHEIRSDRWRDIYIKRVDDLLAKLKEKNTPVYLIGMPAMSSPRLSSDMQYLNEIFRERAVKAGVRYIDVWEGFVDQQGQFISSGPALDGQTRRLRIADGVHFTRFGGRKLAHYVELDLVRLFDARVRGPFLPYGVEQGPIAPGTKPIAGPVLPLTAPIGQARALEGATQNTSAIPASIDPNAAKTLVDGVPLPPVEGRADDFRWPRPAVSFPAKKDNTANTPQTPAQ